MDTLPLEILDHILTYVVAAPVSASMAASCLMTCREFAELTTDITLRERGRIMPDDNDPYNACVAYCEAVYDDAITNGYTDIVRWFATESAISESAYYTALMCETDDMLNLLDSLHGCDNVDMDELARTLIMMSDASTYDRMRLRYPNNCPWRDVLAAVKYDCMDILDVIKRQAPYVFDDRLLCVEMLKMALRDPGMRIVTWMNHNKLEYAVAPIPDRLHSKCDGL